jgi:hypothetical protein
MMTNPSEYRGAYGGGADDRDEWRGQTGGSSIHPWGSVNLTDKLRVARMPPRRRVWFVLGGAQASIYHLRVALMPPRRRVWFLNLNAQASIDNCILNLTNWVKCTGACLRQQC